MSLTKMMAWLNSGIGYSEKSPSRPEARRGLLCEAWITSSYTASVRGGILPAPQEYQNQAGRQPGKTHRPTTMIVETTTISRTIPAQPFPWLIPCFAANASTASLACLRPAPVCSR